MFFVYLCISLYTELLLIVKNIQNYLILFVSLAAIFVCGMGSLNSAVSDVSSEICTSEFVYYYFDSSTSDSDFYLPRRTSTTNIHRLHSTNKRTSNKAYKNFFEFIKAGKVANTGVGNSTYQESLSPHSTFVNLDKRFIRIGKLII